jgi:hypothetical protein
MNRYFLIIIKLALVVCAHGNQVSATNFDLRSDTFIGVTPITADLDDATYSSRAFNDAVRQLMSQVGVNIESFTLIENGKILFDQIQSQSNITVHEYQIEEERRSDKEYKVKVSFLYGAGIQKVSTSRCLKIPTNKIRTYISVRSDTNALPWAHLSADEISDQLSKLSFSPNVRKLRNRNDRGKTNGLYTLSKKQDKKEKYSINVTINYEQISEKGILSKSHLMLLSVDIKSHKLNQLLLNDVDKHQFLIDRKEIGNISISKSRSDWDQTKEAIYRYIASVVLQHVDNLECLQISPNLKLSKGRIKLNFGSEEGVKSNDLILTRDKVGQQIFLKVTQLNKHNTFLTPLSAIEDLSSINLKNVAILDGS